MSRMGIGRFTPETRSALLNVSNADCRELASFSGWLNQFFVHVLFFTVAAVLWKESPLLVLFGVAVNGAIIAILNCCNHAYEAVALSGKQATDAETGFFSRMLVGMAEIKSLGLFAPLADRYRARNRAWCDHYDRQLSSRRVREVLVPSLTMLAELASSRSASIERPCAACVWTR